MTADKITALEVRIAALEARPPCGCNSCKLFREQAKQAAERIAANKARSELRTAFDGASPEQRAATWSSLSPADRADLLRDRSVENLAAIISAAAPSERAGFLTTIKSAPGGPSTAENIVFHIAPVPAYVKVTLSPRPAKSGLKPLARVTGPSEKFFSVAQDCPWIEPAAAWEARAANDDDGRSIRGMLADEVIVVEPLPEAEARKYTLSAYRRGEIDLPSIGA